MLNQMDQNEAMLQQIVLDEQTKMKDHLGFHEVFIPSFESEARCNIFLSPNWSICERLLLIIVSGRGIQPGIWSRSLVLESQNSGISNSYRSGSMLPYLQTAIENGYGVVVTNPTSNSVNIGNEKRAIPCSHTPEVHIGHVWEEYVAKASCNHVYIVAYGRGGVLAKHLVSTQPVLRQKIAALAFIESSHRVSANDHEEVRNLIGTRAINWQRSKVSPGTQLPDCAQLGCLSLSAGEPLGEQTSSNTAWTIGASMNTVFAFFGSTQVSSSPVGMSNEMEYDDMEIVYDDNCNSEWSTRGRSMVISTSMSVNDFDLLSVVGKGAYGKVFLAKKKHGKNSGRVYAMKVLKKQDVFRKHQVEHTKSEQRILKHVEHPFVVRLRYAFQSDYKLYLVTDYYPGGSLFFHLRRRGYFTEERSKFYAAQLLLAISHLHNLHIIYRDLKLENILMDDRGNIAITDFGLSKEDDEGSTFVGTPEYLAPELLSSQRTSTSYGNSIDWWSYGVLVYEMMQGQTPFWNKNRKAMFQNILSTEPTFIPERFSNDAQDFIRALLVKDPPRRLGCGSRGPIEIMSHRWFAGVDWNLLLAKKLQPPFQPNATNGDDTSYVPRMFTQQDAADSPVQYTLDSSGPGRQTMHFEDFSYMGSDIMGSRRTSLFRESDLRIDVGNASYDDSRQPWG